MGGGVQMPAKMVGSALRFRFGALVTLTAALAVSASTMAAAKDWSSGNGGNWSENRNWNGILKFSQGDSANFPASSFSPGVSVVNFDLAPGTDVGGITFAAGSWK